MSVDDCSVRLVVTRPSIQGQGLDQIQQQQDGPSMGPNSPVERLSPRDSCASSSATLVSLSNNQQNQTHQLPQHQMHQPPQQHHPQLQHRLQHPHHSHHHNHHHHHQQQQQQQHQIGLELFPARNFAFHRLEHDLTVGLGSPPLSLASPGALSLDTMALPTHHQQSRTAKLSMTATSAPVRRRISRACDQCNQLRTKCDGRHPCAHCIELKLGCEYMREKKKRGKASRKDLAERAAAAHGRGQSNQPTTRHSPCDMSEQSGHQHQHHPQHHHQQPQQPQHQHAHHQNQHGQVVDDTPVDALTLDLGAGYAAEHDRQPLGGGGGTNVLSSPVAGYGNEYDQHHQMPSYQGLPFGLLSAPCHSAGFDGGAAAAAAFPLGPASLSGYSVATPSPSPGWGIMAVSPAVTPPSLRYPVLEPLVSDLGSVMPVSLACDLLDVYFASSLSAQMHPMSPYVLAFVFRRRAFLHPRRPRRCQPALLASMLWVAAQTSDAPLLTSSPSARGKVRQSLLGLILRHLKPLLHNAAAGPFAGAATAATAATAAAAATAADAGLGAVHVGDGAALTADADLEACVAAGQLDDVVTYIHLATVVSASEYKSASLRWWTAAWCLARELGLGRELPPGLGEPGAYPRMSQERDGDGEHEGLDEHDLCRDVAGLVTEEEREERRRVWWLLYMADRHVALCYNRPLFFLDVECQSLLQPMSDAAWQRGDFKSLAEPGAGSRVPSPGSAGSGLATCSGPQLECRGPGIFGFFLPLMAILGEIVDLHHASSHPRMGMGFRATNELEGQAQEIRQHLDMYERSMQRFEERFVRGDGGGDDVQARIVLAYGSHVMHVLHILLAGKWDPVSLLADSDFWISSQSFITATSHAVSAAGAVSQMLEYDPGLESMPFFLGVYLLQGSLLLLLIADKLQREASPSVVSACETIVRAHEACVVTLSTEYQRNFSKVMRGALAIMRGRAAEDAAEQQQQQRRRELLGLYRWTGGGTGLAL